MGNSVVLSKDVTVNSRCPNLMNMFVTHSLELVRTKNT